MRTLMPQPVEPSVVIADADAAIVAHTRSCLDGRGVRLMDATSGDSAVMMVEDNVPDVLLLDPAMLTSDGEDVMAVLQAEAGDDMPIVVLTSDSPELIARGLELGALDYLERPIREVSLRARVDAALRLKKLRNEVTQQRETLSRLSRVDPLTGLANRLQTETQLQQCAATAARHLRPLSIVLMDLDRFSHVNQIAGTEAGDMVLQDVARHVMADIRNGDVAGRWNGDQFMLLLPETDASGANVLAERLRLTISEFGAELPDGTTRPISASFSCTQGSDVDEMLRSVTNSVQEIKRRGGNAVTRV